jgi:predicted tellurium resistance membrane protein TerC
MNRIFSFDSIFSALAITKVLFVLATAIVVSGVLMLVLADSVSAFIERNRKYEVLGLFILLIVGVVLLGEGGHEANWTLFGFAIFVLVIVDIMQSGYQKKLAAKRAALAT